MSKIIAITGASSGIGLATAKLFAENGWTVYAGTRHARRDQELHGRPNHLNFIEMEVTQPESLKQAFAVIEKEHGKLDVLFANAGFGFLRSLEQASMEEIHSVFDTNVYGVMHTIRAALPLLRQAEAPYIVATTSVGGLVGQPLNEIYCASKFAVEGLLESLATYYKPTFNIDVTLLEPGAIATNFNRTVLSHIEQTGGIREDAYKQVIETYISTFAKRNSVPQTPESVAEVMLRLVSMETKPLRIRTSEQAEAFVRFKAEQDPDGLEGMLNTRKLQLDM